MAPQKNAHAVVRTADRNRSDQSSNRLGDRCLDREGVAEARGAQRSTGWHRPKERTVSSLCGQVIRQVVARQQVFEVVGQQQTLRAVTALVIVHHSALEPQVYEVMVVRIVGRLTGGQPPELEVQQRQECCVGSALREGVPHSDRAREGAEEFDRLAVDRLWSMGADEVNRARAVIGV